MLTERGRRTAVVTPRPDVDGYHTAMVRGPAGQEIYTDKYGRFRVQFHWDREAKGTDEDSRWLRIAQESITNARKHAGASNLWVTCTVDPPFAQVEVSDDGHGMSEQRPDGRYGLAIMTERAERIRGRQQFRLRSDD